MQLIDLHCDTIYELKRRDDGSSLAKNSLSIDLDGMRRAGTILQIFACFIYRKEWKTWEDGYAEVFRLLDRMEQEVEENKDEIRIVHNGSEIEKNRKCGKISAMASLEEGGVLDGKPERLKVLNRGDDITSTQGSDEKNEHGLGLKLVMQIVKAHRGTVSFSDSTPHGLEVRISLPTQPLIS